MFIEAAESCGLDRNQDINGETQLGAGLYHVTQRDGKRCSSAAAYIKPVLDRENLTVQTRAHVTEIRFDGDRAVGVTYEQDGVEHTPDVTGEIVLSAGAFNSPQLLMLQVSAPPTTSKNTVSTSALTSPASDRTSKTTCSASSSTTGPTRCHPHRPRTLARLADICTSTRTNRPQTSSSTSRQSTIWSTGSRTPRDWASIGSTQVRPESVGTVTLDSTNPTADPVIDPQYLTAEPDLTVLRGDQEGS